MGCMSYPTRVGPDWVRHMVWWHVYPLGFAGADMTGADRTRTAGLDQVAAWLDYAVDLGVNGLALGPIFESASHGYDTIDYLRIDPRLGDLDAFRRLVDAAGQRGLRVLLDGVFNHVGRDFPGVRDAEQGRDSDRADWFRRERDGGLATFEGHADLVALDHGNPAVVEFVTSVMRHWLDAGADGWRLDAAYAVPPEFWTRVLPRVREHRPDAYVLGEMLHGDYTDYVRRSGLDAVTQYELWKAIWSSIDSVNFFELDWSLRRHNDFLDAFVPYTFVGNHDVTRLATNIADERHHAHALVLLMTLGGTPSIYYGDEQGRHGVKEVRIGGDDAIRAAYPPTPTDLSPYATGVFRLHQELIRLRHRHPWLHHARSETIALRNEAVVLRARDGDKSLTVALSLDDSPQMVNAACSQLLAGTADRTGEGWLVPGHRWAVLC